MIVIDQVYQKVLALANKEQRGYITPQEFNLLADKAQNEIFDSYFHDVKTTDVKPKNQLGVAFDELEIIQEKLHPFKSTRTWTQVAETSSYDLPSELYLIDTIFQNNIEVVELTKKEIMYTQNNPLTQATTNRRVYARGVGNFSSTTNSESITLYPTPIVDTEFTIDYYERPVIPKWGYVVVSKKALYNEVASTNFQLHKSEEELLVSRILELAGIVIMKPGIVEIAKSDKMSIKAEQNN
tara:strand:+ start:924 stop:1643 length:720 start_codon:yes stop_codon:yes gene_type:complete